MMSALPLRRMIAILLLLGMVCSLSYEIQAATPQLAAGAKHSVALHADGTVYAWGDNTHGQLGNGEAGEGLFEARPVQIQNLTDIVAIAARLDHTLALRSDGTVWAWGRNDQGQLGDGTQTDRSTPVQVNGLSGVAMITTGSEHSFAVRSDGTLWVWGLNGGGRFGNGIAGWDEVSTTPIRVLALSDVVAAAAGYGQSFAIKSDGTLWAWGDNSDGKLGLGTFSEIETLPVQVTNLRNVTGIMAHAGHVMAQTADGRLWSWGADNETGQLGNGSTEPSALPVAVLQPNGDPTAFALGWAHSVARFMDGRLWTWGNNWYGQLGLGEVDHQLSPVQVETLTTVEAIAAGEYHTLAMTANGDVWAWGAGGQGRLGQGEGEFNQTRPRQVLDPDGTAFLNLWQTPAVEARLVIGIVGLGRVHDDSGTLDCPGVCEAMFSTDQEIRLSATPDFGWSFAGWGGSCTGALDCLLTLDGPTSVTANFTQQSNRYQLDSPVNGSFESGIGVAHGWVCEANQVDLQVDESIPFTAAHGAERADSQLICGDTANGFAAAINWSDYGDGAHTLTLLADGQALTTATVTVTTLGESFITGLSATTTVSDFPEDGLTTTLAWSEPHQNFVVSDGAASPTDVAVVSSATSTGNWESPLAGGVESGQALIRGWVCEAGTVTVSLDGTTLSLPYGSEREDTQAVCGDTDNGYALAINWNDYADGMHQITLNLDGQAVETRSFDIATPAGQGYVSGVQRQHRLAHFPHPADELRLQWSEPHQNFRLIDYQHSGEARDDTWRVTEIYIATLGYAPDDEGLRYWVANLQGGDWTPTTVAQSFFDQPLVQALYPITAGYEALIEALYQNLFGRAADAGGRTYWLGELNAGRVSRNQMIIALIEGGWSNPEAMTDMARFGNRVQVGLAFAAAQAEQGIRYSTLTPEAQARLREIGADLLADVTDDMATREAAIASITERLATLP